MAILESGSIPAKALRLPGRAVHVARRKAKYFFTPPAYPGVKLTPKRLLNLWLVRWEWGRTATRLHGYPLVLTMDATNACNLRCPYCLTGAGAEGRDKRMLQMPLYKKMLDEMGEYVFNIEFYNWGEPLLNKHIEEMIAMADAKGISTLISSNLSVPLTAERAEKIVASGLDVLTASIDGATQEVYEIYRQRGDLSLVVQNVRLLNEAKRKLGSKTPELVWGYHIFPHNKHEVEQARAMATELGMTFAATRAWLIDEEWDVMEEFGRPSHKTGTPKPCFFLWERAVVNPDGRVAPCCGTYFAEHDYGTVGAAGANGEPSVDLTELASSSFRDVWNNEKFRASRRMFKSRSSTPAWARDLICYECPAVTGFEKFRSHMDSGQEASSFVWPYGPSAGWNFFFKHRPDRAQPAPKNPPDDVIPLVETEAPAGGD